MASQPKARKTPAKHYGQYCAVARSLDVLGERWTLLVVRSLLLGPQRYTDLRDALPGIATDLLTARLRTLEDAGYVRRRELPRPAPATVYELTDSGRQLGQVVLALARIGIDRLGAPADDESINPAALVLALRASYHSDCASASDASYQLNLDEESFVVTTHEGNVDTIRGQADHPVSTITTSARTLAQLLSGAIDPDTASARGDVQIDGPPTTLTEFLGAFVYRVPSHPDNG